MDEMLAKETVDQFNDCIDAKDIQRLARMMTDDHVFEDAANNRVSGKQACVRAWREFFAAFPDYRNEFELVVVREDIVIAVGRSSCSDARLDGPAIWTAKVRGRRVSEWRVFEDTGGNRAALGLKD